MSETRKRAKEEGILMEGSEREQEERGVSLRVLKVHGEDSRGLLS